MSGATVRLTPWFIAGPTGVGKSGVALALAERIGGEIISVDSMQVYRGMDIGTAKPSAAEQTRVRHHLLDVVGLTEPFSAAEFVRLAGGAVANIEQRRKVPIFCGGTGLYFQAYLEGLGETPPPDPGLRATLEPAPLDELLQELQRTDPATFDKIDRANKRRVIRALEIIRITGKPVAAQKSPWSRGSAAPRIEVKLAQRNFVGLERAHEDLVRRIDRRVERMFEKGLVDEVTSLMARGLEQNKTAMQALGYRQVVEFLRGVRSLDETVALIQTKTRQYAKRQRTWFRQQPGLRWVSVAELEDPQQTAVALLET